VEKILQLIEKEKLIFKIIINSHLNHELFRKFLFIK